MDTDDRVDEPVCLNAIEERLEVGMSAYPRKSLKVHAAGVCQNRQTHVINNDSQAERSTLEHGTKNSRLLRPDGLWYS